MAKLALAWLLLAWEVRLRQHFIVPLRTWLPIF